MTTRVRRARSCAAAAAQLRAKSKGDTVKLELLGRDAPYLRPSNTPFSVEVSNLSAVVPTN